MTGVSTSTLPAIIVGGWGTSSASLPLISSGLFTGSIQNLPLITGEGLADSADPITLPAITASSTGVTGGITNPSSPSLDLPFITAAGTGDPGVLGSSASVLPAITGSGRSIDGSEVDLPATTGSATGATGQVGVSIAFIPLTIASSTGDTQVLGVSSESVPAITAIGAALAGRVGVSSLILAPTTAEAQGYAGVVGQSSLILPSVGTGGTGGALAVGTSILILPSIIAIGRGSNGIVAAYSTIAMHTETTALTSYSNFPFNSLAVFNGKPLAAGDSGLFLLEGADDDGTAIAAVARGRVSDFDTSFRKRVPRVYVGGRFDGDMVLRVITDEAHTRDYTLRSTGADGLHGNHVKIGKGVNSRYWQFEIQNTEGCDFDIDTIECKPIVTRRRIGGRDA